MSRDDAPRVLIVGAGAMGMIVGRNMSLAGAEVTFLVRPHRVEALRRPQQLYCHDDGELTTFGDHAVVTDLARPDGSRYDVVLVTLDGASLVTDEGRRLVRRIGDVARGTATSVVLGTVSLGLRSWFLAESGLADAQVTNAYLGIHCYATAAVTLPVHPPTDAERLGRADFAFADRLGVGLTVDDSAPDVATRFAEIYNACGVSRCAVVPAPEAAVAAYPMFAVFATCRLLDWPPMSAIDTEPELWGLTVAAVREIQGLRIHGEPGRRAAAETTAGTLAASLAAWEQQMLPLDLQAFNRFHHGSKVAAQDAAHLHNCLRAGHAEGALMPALNALTRIAEFRSPRGPFATRADQAARALD